MSFRLLPRKPEFFHGKDRSRPYFEGWYFKLSSPNDDFSLVIIPGVNIGKDQENDHSFIQVLYGNKSHYTKLPRNKFKCKKDEFKLKVSQNLFSRDKVIIDIKENDFQISAELSFTHHIQLKTNFYSPSIMGPFSYLPGMQCNHGVLSLDCKVNGAVKINGKNYNIKEYNGYIEKDWGSEFPKSWLWLQCNGPSSESGRFSLMCSIASIPFGLIKFRGLIAYVYIDGKQILFSTYNFSKIKKLVKIDKGAEVILKKSGYEIHVKAMASDDSVLKAPKDGEMKREILESITAKIEVVLYQYGKEIYSSTYNSGGLETSELGSIIS